MTNDEKANIIIAELQEICNKHNIEIGVWLTWRDLNKNLRIMEATPGFDEAFFGFQIKFQES